MKPLKYITAFALMLAIVFTVFTWQTHESDQRHQQEINALKSQIEAQDKTISTLLDEAKEKEHLAAENLEKINDLSERIESNRQELDNKISRGDTEVRRMRVTAYDLSYESCQKYPSHPEYGITASGEKVKEWYTVAAGPELPFVTRIYVPYFKDYENKGIFVVKDRGGLVKKNCIDIFIADRKAMDAFGVKYLEVYVLKGE